MAFLKQKIEIGVEEAELKALTTVSAFPKWAKWAVIILFIGLIPGYFIGRHISQKLWLKKNQQTAFTAKPSFTNAKLPEYSELTFKKEAGGSYSVWAKVSNKNLGLSLEKANFYFKFYSAQNKIVHQDSGQFFLLPNQSKYVTVPSFSISERIEKAEITFEQNLRWQKRLPIPQVVLNPSSAQISQQAVPPALTADGSYVNNSPYTLRDVTITFKLLDKQNTVLNVVQRIDNTIPAFGRRAYKFSWPEYAGQDAGVFRSNVSVETNVLDSTNLSASAE